MEALLWSVAITNSLAVLVVVVGASVRFIQGRNWVRECLADKVVIHTRDNNSIRGILITSTDNEVVLREAQYLQEGLPEKLLGEIGVPKANVAFIQRLSFGTEPIE